MVTTERYEAVANRIEISRTQADRSVRWLSTKTGIPQSTLRRKLYKQPETLSLQELAEIAAALGADETYLHYGLVA